jgi:hypothetical protein
MVGSLTSSKVTTWSSHLTSVGELDGDTEGAELGAGLRVGLSDGALLG